MYAQLLGRADKRQLSNPSIGMTHNLGGAPPPERLLYRHRRPLQRLTAKRLT